MLLGTRQALARLGAIGSFRRAQEHVQVRLQQFVFVFARVPGLAAAVDFEWNALMRPEWQGNPLVVRGYVTLRADKSGFTPNPKVLDLGETRVAIFAGHIKYLAPQETQVRVRRKYLSDPPEISEPAIELNVFPDPFVWTNAEFHTLIATLGSLDSPGEPLARIEEIAGLLITFESTRLVLHQLFEMQVILGTPDQLSIRSRPVAGPDDFKEADVSDQRLAAIVHARNMIEAFDEKKKNRFLLSLRWLDAATRQAASSATPDVFLAYWIALEALAMPDDTNIRPLNEALGAIYGIDAGTARTQFLTGKLYGLRSAIVHDGNRATITLAILRYLERLYVDLFFHEVGAASEQRAGSYLASVNVEQDVDAALA